MTREEIQSNAVKLAKTYPNLLLEWCTGLGKTKAALDIVSKLPGRGYIILAEKAHIKNWMKEIDKYKYQDILLKCEIFLYASLHKFKDTQVDWIIFDECHHLSDLRKDNLSTIKSNYNIFLTATIDSNQLFELSRLYFHLKRDYISLYKAIEWEIIPKPQINLIPLQLKSDSNTEEIIITKGKEIERTKIICSYNERWNYLKKYPNLELIIKCTQKQKYEWFEENMEYWKQQYFRSRLEYQKNKWLQLGSQRKRFLAEIKTPYINDILINTKRRKQRFICFAGSIDQCNILGAGIDVVHSKKKNNQQIIDSFNSGEINSLFAVGMLQEGINLKDIEIGIIIQLDSKLRSYTQRAGRIFRSQQPIQYIFYIENTRDEEYLKEIIKGLEQYINIIK